MKKTKNRGGIEVRTEWLSRQCARVRLSGYIDTYNSSYCREQVDTILNRGANHLLFDMRRLSYVSSTGIGLVFVDTLKQVKKNGGSIILAAMIARVEEVFQLLGVKSFFTRTATVEEGMACLPAEARTAVPFGRMEALTASFARLEQMVAVGRQVELYGVLLEILGQIDALKEGRGVPVARDEAVSVSA